MDELIIKMNRRNAEQRADRLSPVALLEQEAAALGAVLLVALRLVQAVRRALPHLGILGKHSRHKRHVRGEEKSKNA